ncbi:MAG: hypothetical protein IPL07_15820 [Acidimicrobiaceae bacterium]|nr:hypothetical protein [Acidimicrobiaceae bacterium]
MVETDDGDPGAGERLHQRVAERVDVVGLVLVELLARENASEMESISTMSGLVPRRSRRACDRELVRGQSGVGVGSGQLLDSDAIARRRARAARGVSEIDGHDGSVDCQDLGCGDERDFHVLAGEAGSPCSPFSLGLRRGGTRRLVRRSRVEK